MRTWIKDPLAVFADGAERGLVVEGTRIAEASSTRTTISTKP
jgi:8-oxoguanine deaminase